MAKKLPYFRWYPADAEMDACYAGMTDQEVGLYHRMLNRAWTNGGSLPADLDELARVLGRTREYLGSVLTPRLSRCWEEKGGRLVNRRQESEFRHAQKISKLATDAVRSRYASVAPRAYEAAAVSKKTSSAEKAATRAAADGDWPATTWAITQKFETASSKFVCRVIEAAFAALHKNGGQPGDLVDTVLAGIVRDAIEAKPQGQAGLLLDTVPEIIESRLLREKRRKAATEAADRRRGPEPASRSQEGLFLLQERES